MTAITSCRRSSSFNLRVGTPWATNSIAGATFVISGLLIATHYQFDAAIIGGFIPRRATGVTLPPELGWLMPVWLTPLTSSLVHAGWVHLGFNLLMFVYCGREAEKAIGWRGMIPLYVIGAYAAAAGQWAFNPQSMVPRIGASGAISAVVAAYALFFGARRAKAIGPIPANIVHATWLAAAWIGVQLLIGVAGLGDLQIAIGAHIGGFIAGLLLAKPLLLWRFRKA
ncbi:N/A [soil metagenome]